MKQIIAFLEKHPVQYLATVGIDGKAGCRPFMFCGENEGKLWFATDCTKAVYRDLGANPGVELAAGNDDGPWLRIKGNARFGDNQEIRQHCLSDPWFREYCQLADESDLRLFYLADVKAKFYGIKPVE